MWIIVFDWECLNDMDKFEQFLMCVEVLFGCFEGMLLFVLVVIDWNVVYVFCWCKCQGCGYLQLVLVVLLIMFGDLYNIDCQKVLIDQNMWQFVQCKLVNNVLLIGVCGIGKLLLIKVCLNVYVNDGLCLIEVDKDDLYDFGDIVDLILQCLEWFIVFCDDLLFEDGELGYKVLKVVLDGLIVVQLDNVLIYVMLNCCYLFFEYMSDNELYKYFFDGEIYFGEVVEEKILLLECFGLWVSFYLFKQDDYFDIVVYWLCYFGCLEMEIDMVCGDVFVWVFECGLCLGCVVWQFVWDWLGCKEQV